MGYHCWNEEALETAVRDLTVLWDNFETTLNHRLSDNLGFINTALDWAINHLGK